MALYEEISRWPLREALLAYIELMKEDAFTTYQQMLDWYMQGRLADKPRLPEILKDG